jgi:predicted DNA-binding protein (UPF0251 family)
MGLTAEQLADLGLTPEEGQNLLRLTTKIQENQKARAQNSEVARRSFAEWLADVVPKVAKALSIAASVVTTLLTSISELAKAL